MKARLASQLGKLYAWMLCLVAALAILLSSCTRYETPETTLGTGTSTIFPSSTHTVPSATAIQNTFTPTVSAIPRMIPTTTPMGTVSVPTATVQLPTAQPVVSEAIAHIAEKEVFYVDGAQFPPEIWKVDLETSERTNLLSNEEPGFEVSDIRLSPQKDFLAFSFSIYEPTNSQVPCRSGLQIMRPDGSQLQILVETTAPDWVIGFPNWSPDGTQIAYLREYLTPGGYPHTVHLHVFDLERGRDRVITEEGGLFDWSPEGDRIVYAGRNGHSIYSFDLVSGEKQTVWENEMLIFGQPVWQPSGEQLAVAARQGDAQSSSEPETGLYLVELVTRKWRKIISGDIYGIQWSPDGKKLVYLTFAPRINRLWLVDLETASPSKLLDTTVQLGTPAWSMDGHTLLLAVEQELEHSYWISIMAVTDQSLVDFVLARTMRPYSTW